jgi:hypothetical protein
VEALGTPRDHVGNTKFPAPQFLPNMITTAIINHVHLSIVSTFTHSMRSTSTSSTSPLSHHTNKSSFPQSSLTLVSPPTSINGEDTLPHLGFGWEFELTLEERMRQKEHEIVARFQRYERFGMRLEEARLPTPDRFRTAYDELLEAINNDRTPSPSPEYGVGSNRNPRKMNVTQRHFRRKNTTKKGMHGAIRQGLRYLADDFFYSSQLSQSWRQESNIETKAGQGNPASAPEASRPLGRIESWDENALENGGFAKDMKATCMIILNFK